MEHIIGGIALFSYEMKTEEKIVSLDTFHVIFFTGCSVAKWANDFLCRSTYVKFDSRFWYPAGA